MKHLITLALLATVGFAIAEEAKKPAPPARKETKPAKAKATPEKKSDGCDPASCRDTKCPLTQDAKKK